MLANAVRPPIIILLTNGADECERTRILGLRRLVVNLGAGFAASIGGILASINFHWVFISDGIAALVVMVILIVFSKCLGNQNAASSQVEKKDTHKIAQVRKHDIKKFIFLSLLVFAVELVFIQLNVTYPIYLKDIYHLSIRTDQVRILL
jgi:MFS family permease